MRISSRLILNAVSTNARLAITFVMSLFMAWYTVGEAGLIGFGAIVMTAGTFGFANVLILAIRQSVIRDLAAALSDTTDDRPECVVRTMTACMAIALLCAGVVLVLFVILSLLAALGVFRTDDVEGLPGALTALFIAAGVISVVNMLLLPYVVALVADQQIPLDGVLIVVNRIMPPMAAVLTFEVVAPTETLLLEGIVSEGEVLARQLYTFAVIRLIFGLIELALRVIVTRVRIPELRWRLGAFDRATFREIMGSTWQTAQFLLGTNLTLQALMLLVNLIFGLTFNGIWQILIVVSGQAKMLGDSLLYGLEAMSASLHAGGQHESLLTLASRTIRYQAMVILCFVACFLVFIDPILTLWMGSRIALDENLAAANITVDEAMRLVIVLSAIGLLAEIPRATSRGLERVMYGMGLVRTYAWFAKWSFLVTMVLSLILMLWTGELVSAVLVILVLQVAYFMVVIPLAARRHIGLSLRQMINEAWLRPLLTVAVLLGPVILLRMYMPVHTIVYLLLAVAACGVCACVACLFVGLNAGERHRVLQLMRGMATRAFR
jgi:hypothetical protein